jgi:hypothetical protein
MSPTVKKAITDSEKLQKRIDNILSEPFWPPSLKTGIVYETTHDDNDGDPESGMLFVQLSFDGDAWVHTLGECLRFRMPIFGGGKFPKIRNALFLLAEAIRQEGISPERKKT